MPEKAPICIDWPAGGTGSTAICNHLITHPVLWMTVAEEMARNGTAHADDAGDQENVRIDENGSGDGGASMAALTWPASRASRRFGDVPMIAIS